MKYILLLLCLWTTQTMFSQQATNDCLHQYLIHIREGFNLSTQERPDFTKALTYYQKAQSQARKCKRKDLSLLIKGRAILLDRIMKQYQAMQLSTFGDKGAIEAVERTHVDWIEAFNFDLSPLRLVCRDGKFGYVRRNGQLAIDYAYATATNFEARYFAEVRKEANGPLYLLDTLGRAYLYGEGTDVPADMRAYFVGDTEDEELAVLLEQHQQLEVIQMNLSFVIDFPKNITLQKELKYLDASYNSFEVLPASIGALQKLETLILFSNDFKTLPEEIGNLQALRYLDLSDNELETLPESFYQLKNLEYLDLEGNPTLFAQKEAISARMDWCKIHWGKLKEVKDDDDDLNVDDLDWD